MKDASKYLRLVLLSNAAVLALVSGRVFEAPMPKDGPFPCLSYDLPPAPAVGGGIQVRTATVTCWAETLAAATSLYQALWGALFGEDVPTWLRLSDGTVVFGIHQVISESREVSDLDKKESKQFTMSFAMPTE
jgi:hypothetical protein